MKRYNRVLILVAVLAVAVAAAVTASKIQEKKEEIRTSGEPFLTVSPDTVTALSFHHGDTGLAFHKGDTWLWDDDEAFPVDQDKMAKLLSDFDGMAAAFIIDDVEDYAQYGLAEPECTVELTAGDASCTVKMGAYSALDQQRYVDIGDGKVYLVADDPVEDFEVELSDLIANDSIPVLAPASFSVSGAAELDAKYDEEGDSCCAEDVYFTDTGLPLDTGLVNDWLDRFETLTLTDYVTYNATEEELASCGLDSPGLTVKITQQEGDPLTLELSRITPEDAESEEDARAYIRVNGSPIVYSIAPTDYDLISAASYDDLRHRELFTADFAAVTSLDVTLEGETHTFTLGEDENGQSVWTYNGETFDMSAIETAVTALSATSFSGEEPTGQQEIALTIHLSDENHPELALTLYRRDGSTCAAVVNGQPVGALPRSSVIDLTEAVNAVVLG